MPKRDDSWSPSRSLQLKFILSHFNPVFAFQYYPPSYVYIFLEFFGQNVISMSYLQTQYTPSPSYLLKTFTFPVPLSSIHLFSVQVLLKHSQNDCAILMMVHHVSNHLLNRALSRVTKMGIWNEYMTFRGQDAQRLKLSCPTEEVFVAF
jgi:hypothetical protein